MEETNQMINHLTVLCSQKETQILTLIKEKQELSESRRNLADKLRTVYDEVNMTWKKMDECVQERSNLERENETYKNKLDKMKVELDLERKERRKIEDVVSLMKKREKEREEEMTVEKKRMEMTKMDLMKQMNGFKERENELRVKLLGVKEMEENMKKDADGLSILNDQKKKLFEMEKSLIQFKENVLKEKQKNVFISEALKFLVKKFDLQEMKKIFFDEKLFFLSLNDFEKSTSNIFEDFDSYFDYFFFKSAPTFDKEKLKNLKSFGLEKKDEIAKSLRNVVINENFKKSMNNNFETRKKLNFSQRGLVNGQEGSLLGKKDFDLFGRSKLVNMRPSLRRATRTLSGNFLSGEKIAENVENVENVEKFPEENVESVSNSLLEVSNRYNFPKDYALKEVKNEMGNVIARINTRNKFSNNDTKNYKFRGIDNIAQYYGHGGIYQ